MHHHTIHSMDSLASLFCIFLSLPLPLLSSTITVSTGYVMMIHLFIIENELLSIIMNEENDKVVQTERENRHGIERFTKNDKRLY